MILKNSIKLKIQRAVTIALISSGIIPAIQAEVTDQNVNNPSGTTITNGSTSYAVDLDSGGPYTVINAGTISTVKATSTISAIEIDEVAVTTLTNTGTMSAETVRSGAFGIHSYTYNDTTSITTLTNSGTISGEAGTDGYGIYLYTGHPGSGNSTITNLTNKGTISGSTYDIWNKDEDIINFNNQQGKAGNDVLTYNGKLPTNYNIIVASTSDYGQASFTDEEGTTNFGVSSSSTFSGSGTYASVINGLAAGSIGATRSGTVGGYGWSLVLQTGQTDIWDLVITSSRIGYTSRITINSLSKIAAILEVINTAGSNSTLTSALDGLSDASLDKALNQIEGVTIKSVNGQSFKKHSTFKRAVSSALSGPSVNSLTKNNYASLSLNDLSLPSNQSGYQVHSFNDFDFKSMVNIFKNKDLFSLKSKGSTFLLELLLINLIKM